MSKLAVKGIEVNLTEHCNLKCSGCDHASPHLPAKFASLAGVQADLAVLAGVLQADEIKLVGGEALMHPQVIDFMKMMREIKIAKRVVLITNGVLLHNFTDVYKYVDRIWVSIYPGVKHRAD